MVVCRKPDQTFLFCEQLSVQSLITSLKMSNNQYKRPQRGALKKKKKTFIPFNKYKPFETKNQHLLELLQQLRGAPAGNLSRNILFEGYKKIRADVIVNKPALKPIQKNGARCALVNAGSPPSPLIKTALEACVRHQVPVVAVPSLSTIMADIIGVNCELVVFRDKSKNPVMTSIIIKVRQIAKQNPVALPYFKEVAPKLDPRNQKELKDFPLITEENVTKYYPLVNDSDFKRINNLLTRLPDLKVRAAHAKQPPKIGLTFPEIRSHLYFHPKPLWKLLRKGEASCVLICNEKYGDLYTKKIIHICILEKVPVLVLPTLKNSVFDVAALDTFCLGIKKNPTSPLLKQIADTVVSIAKNYPCPSDDSDNEEYYIEELGGKQKITEMEIDENVFLLLTPECKKRIFGDATDLMVRREETELEEEETSADAEASESLEENSETMEENSDEPEENETSVEATVKSE